MLVRLFQRLLLTRSQPKPLMKASTPGLSLENQDHNEQRDKSVEKRTLHRQILQLLRPEVPTSPRNQPSSLRLLTPLGHSTPLTSPTRCPTHSMRVWSSWKEDPCLEAYRSFPIRVKPILTYWRSNIHSLPPQTILLSRS